jgi:arabinofuranosyltransferase
MVWLIAAMAVAVGLSFGAVTQDDAFISFRYAEHLTQGHGLVFNVGEWVEGYTNLLWTLMLAGAMALGGEPVICSTVMGLVALAGTIVATWRLGKGHGVSSIALIAAPLLVALDAQFILESVEGLETALFVWLVTLGTSAALHGGRWGGAHWFVLAALTRPEGVLLWGFLQVGLLLRAWLDGRAMPQLRLGLRESIPIVLCLALLTAWRLMTYGDPLPNTFYAKTGGFPVARGLAYLWTHMVSHPTVWSLGLLGAWWGRKRADTLPLVTIVGLYLSYVIGVGGDFKPTGRFIIPVLPMLAVLAQCAVERIVRSPPTGRLIFGLSAIVCTGWASNARYQQAKIHGLERHANLEARKLVGDWIAAHTPTDAVLAIHSAGVIPFYANRRTIDMWGLTDRTIARTKVTSMGQGMAGHEKTNPAYVFGRAPDLYLPEDKVFTIRAWTLETEPGFPEDFLDHYRSVSVPIEGRHLNMWVRR